MMTINSKKKFQIAEYKEQIVNEYMGNPYLEALPEIQSTMDLMDMLGEYPDIYHSEDLNNQQRLHMISKLSMLYQPLERDLMLASRISQVIRKGYVGRNPMNPNAYAGVNGSFSNGFLIIGPSGIGKTTALRRILQTYPQVISHSEYKGQQFSALQLVWIHVETSFDGSIKSILFNIISAIDLALGTNYYSKHCNGKKSIDMLIGIIGKLFRLVGVGVLIIDEIQNLNQAKSGYAEKLLNFFVTLNNQISVPIIMIGNPNALPIMNQSLRLARRIQGEAMLILDRVSKKSTEWKLLLNTLQRYQFVSEPFEINESIRTALYDCSQGIIDILIKVYASAQTEAIMSGSEVVNAQLVYHVFETDFQLIHRMIHALRTGKQSELFLFDDLSTENYINSISSADLSRFADTGVRKTNLTVSTKTAEITAKKKRRKYDLNTLRQNDLRLIVATAKEEKITAYDGLKERGLISDLSFLKLEA